MRCAFARPENVDADRGRAALTLLVHVPFRNPGECSHYGQACWMVTESRRAEWNFRLVVVAHVQVTV